MSKKPSKSGWYEFRHKDGSTRRYLVREAGFVGENQKYKSVFFAHLDGENKGRNFNAKTYADEFNGEWVGPIGDGPDKVWLESAGE